MPKVVLAVCEKCGETFIMNISDIALMPGMRPRLRKQDDKPRPIHTWADWIEHISNNCPDCRFAKPPTGAVEDLERIKEKNKDTED